MKLSDHDLEKLHGVAMTAAEQAGALIQAKVGAHRETNLKAGGDTLASQVVTEVDVESQQLILEVLRESIVEYELGLLAEESEDNSSRFQSDAFWCIDPLDGTLPFIEGTAGYSVSIALVSRQGGPLIGAVCDPVVGKIFHARLGAGAFCNSDPISMEVADDDGGESLTWLMDRSMQGLPHYSQLETLMEQLAWDMGCSNGLKVIDHAGAALNACWVMQHAPAVYFKLPKTSCGGGSLWDFAASACVMQEWGMGATDSHGEKLDLNRQGSTFMNERGVIYASSPRLLKLVEELGRSVLTATATD